MDVAGLHVYFIPHKRRLRMKVYVCNLPLGMGKDDIFESFAKYGNICAIQPIYKTYHDRRLDTGDRYIVYDQLQCTIPSYVTVRGWKAYVYYYGQLCRVCHNEGHFANDCPTRKREEQPGESPMDQQDSTGTEHAGEHGTYGARRKK